MDEPLSPPSYTWRSEDSAKDVTFSRGFGQFLADFMSLRESQRLPHPFNAQNLLGLFAGNANIEFGIAKRRFKQSIGLIKGSHVTLVDKQFPHLIRLKSPRGFIVEFVEGEDGNVFDFLNKPAPREYGLVTINGVDYRFNSEFEGGDENTAFLRVRLPEFVSKGGLVIARFYKGEELLNDRQVWKLIHRKDMFGGVFIKIS
ncbi:hypothetical protein HY041_00755 [Candidatus Roizmanbacteria bacterium]|nr:hypothetical protein [Candidatus Roizmanbacteria bacterium]